MFDCNDVLHAMRDTFDDPLAEESRRLVLAHLTGCRNCRALYDSVRHTIRLTTKSGSLDIPEGLSTRILEKIKKQEPS